MTVTLLKRLATLVALVCLAATLNTSAVGAQDSRPGTEAALAGDQTPEQQIERLYGAVFDRAPDEAGFAFWVNELRSGARNLRQIADAMVGISPEFTQTYGNLDNRDFVNRLYLNVQGRPGETAGVDFWTGQLDTQALTRGGVVLGFSESREYRIATGSADPLDRLYCAFFLRNPDSAGKTFWTDQYLVQERSLNSIAQSFTGVAEFSDRYGTLSNRQFVELIYRNVLGRSLPLVETEGPAFWTDQLNTGARTRGQVMVEFSESTEYRNRWTRNAPCPSAGTAVAEAVNDAATVTFVGSTNINWAANDTAPAGTSVTFTQGTNGTVTDNGDGTFRYTRNGNNATTDSFTYTLTLDGQTSTATVTITILAAGTDAAAVADRFIVVVDTPTPLSVLANDTATGRTVSLASSTSAKGGTLTVVGQNINYAPATGYTLGRDADNILDYDTFDYILTETATGTTSTATVTVLVLAQPECEVFMNFPNGADNQGVGGDDTQLELFFSLDACVEAYGTGSTFAVAWNNLTLDGNPTTASVGSGPLQGIVAVTPADIADDQLSVAGTAVLSDDGVDVVSIEFSLTFDFDGVDRWTRDVASYNGRGDDVTIIVNPLS